MLELQANCGQQRRNKARTLVDAPRIAPYNPRPLLGAVPGNLLYRRVNDRAMLSSVAQGLRILIWQLLGLLLLTAGTGLLYDGRVARSVLVGGGIGLLATSYLVFVLIKRGLQPTRPATVLGLFANWFVKTLLVLGLLVIAMRSRALLPPAILLGLAASLVLYWLAVMTRSAEVSGESSAKERDKANG